VTQLDVEWRRRLEFAAFHYAEAKKAVIRATEHAQFIPRTDGYCDMQEIMAAERVALREYTQILAIFTRLVLEGKTPNEYESDWSCPRQAGQDSSSSHT
jgi:hypothetical protein